MNAQVSPSTEVQARQGRADTLGVVKRMDGLRRQLHGDGARDILRGPQVYLHGGCLLGYLRVVHSSLLAVQPHLAGLLLSSYGSCDNEFATASAPTHSLRSLRSGIFIHPTTPALNPRLRYMTCCVAPTSSRIAKASRLLSSSCSESYTAINSLKSCVCRPRLLSLMFACAYNMTITFFQTSAPLTTIALFAIKGTTVTSKMLSDLGRKG